MEILVFGHRHLTPEPVQPGLPIAPFFGLVFAFLALAFLIIAMPFSFATTHEGSFQLTNWGEAEELVQGNAPPNGTVRLVVRVEADRKGTVTKIAVRDFDAGDPKPLGTDFSELGRELRRLQNDLNIRPVKLILELDATLPYSRVVELLDLATAAGFADIAPVPHQARGPIEIEVFP